MTCHSIKSKGFTLVELIVFIVVLGIAISGVFMAFSTVLLKTPTADHQTILTQLATERMELILGQRRLIGYANGTDICVGSPTLPSCVISTWTNYTVTSSVTNVTLSGDANYKQFTVIAADSGSSNVVQLDTLVANLNE